MKRLLLAFTLTFTISLSTHAADLEKFAQRYFNVMTATQAPNATKADLERYFELLVDDIGHSHLTMMEVLEMEDGKVAVIRKYHE